MPPTPPPHFSTPSSSQHPSARIILRILPSFSLILFPFVGLMPPSTQTQFESPSVRLLNRSKSEACVEYIFFFFRSNFSHINLTPSSGICFSTHPPPLAELYLSALNTAPRFPRLQQPAPPLRRTSACAITIFNPLRMGDVWQLLGVFISQ